MRTTRAVKKRCVGFLLYWKRKPPALTLAGICCPPARFRSKVPKWLLRRRGFSGEKKVHSKSGPLEPQIVPSLAAATSIVAD